MKMKVSISTSGIVSRREPEKGFALLKECGFDAVDLDLTYMLPMRVWNVLVPREESPFENMDDEALRLSVKPIKEAAEKYGIDIGQVHAVYHGTFDREEFHQRHAEMLKRQIMLCDYLNCPRIVVHPEYRYYENRMSEEESWESNRKVCVQMIDSLKQHRVTMCLENIFQSHRGAFYAGVCCDAREVNRYIDTLNEMAGEKCFACCLDTGHALLAGTDVKDFIRTVGHRLEALHLNDNMWTDDDHMLPYTGKLLWPRVYEGLKEIGYRNTINFELTLSHIDPELYPEALRYVSAAGRLFARRIEEE